MVSQDDEKDLNNICGRILCSFGQRRIHLTGKGKTSAVLTSCKLKLLDLNHKHGVWAPTYLSTIPFSISYQLQNTYPLMPSFRWELQMEQASCSRLSWSMEHWSGFLLLANWLVTSAFFLLFHSIGISWSISEIKTHSNCNHFTKTNCCCCCCCSFFPAHVWKGVPTMTTQDLADFCGNRRSQRTSAAAVAALQNPQYRW